MSIKSGELIHVGNQVLVHRAQTAGPGSLNIPTEKIYELGNYQSVATVRDTPDLSFSMDSLDCSAAMEALLTGNTFATDAAGTMYDLGTCKPMDVASQFKRGKTDAAPYDVAASVVAPFLTPDRISYNFGLKSNASQTVSLRGDSIYFAAGSAYVQTAAGTNAANQPVVLANTALPYMGDTTNGARYALSVELVKSGKRLTPGSDYSEIVTGAGTPKSVTVTVLAAVPTTETIRIAYQSDVVATYPQVSNIAASATRPAAVRGRDIEVRVGGTTITDRWSSVQTFTADWSVTLDKVEEFGNPNVIDQDYDVPAVTGTVEVKPRDVQELLKKIRQVAGVVDDLEVVGPLSSVALTLEVIIHSPTDGQILKTLWIEDARFTIPGFSGQVQQKLSVSFAWESDGGNLKIYKGAKP